MRFHDRAEAGCLLAQKLNRYAGYPTALVLGLSRGGVPIAREIARHLHLPFDVFVVRKIGVPGREELALGAIATGGVRVLNQEVITALRVPPTVIDAIAATEWQELHRRETLYRGSRPPLALQGRTVILTDDGIATGSTMRAAVTALQKLAPRTIVVATPTAALAATREPWPGVDELVTVMTPADFSAVGEWYENFDPTTDEVVQALLEQHASFVLPEPPPT